MPSANHQTEMLIRALIGQDVENSTLYRTNAWFKHFIDSMAVAILPEMISAAKRAAIGYQIATEADVVELLAGNVELQKKVAAILGTEVKDGPSSDSGG